MLFLPFEKIRPEHAPLVGGKALSLAALAQTGSEVPDGLAVTTEAYHQYLTESGIASRIHRELSRRPIDQMRWEEMWDSSLRIRNAFLKTPMPSQIRRSLLSVVRTRFKGTPVAVRSSAPGEDASGHSFAGLHESYLNVHEATAILRHIRLVWASLWSDAALLYRKELGLDIEKSAMAVVVQVLVSGNRSGVVFGRHPVKSNCVAVEAVHGLNQGLVDGTVTPDRWTLDRRTGELIEFHPAERKAYVALSRDGVKLRRLPKARANRTPLSDADLRRVYALAMQLSEKFLTPQDVEWTFRRSRLYVLQSRAITTAGTGEGDKRAWYLSLRRSVGNLRELRARIENDLLPQMDEEARRWEENKVHGLAHGELVAELATRHDHYELWLTRYWEECIPFAHGVRLFGQFYNDAMQPEDPYEFVALLSGGGLLSVKRNEALQQLAVRAGADKRLLRALERGEPETGQESFWAELDAFGSAFAHHVGEESARDDGRKAIAGLLVQMVNRPSAKTSEAKRSKKNLEKAFLAKFRGKKRKEAEELLDLGRASYRLRDDDNIYLGRIARQVDIARDEAKRRGLPLPARLSKSLGMRPTGGQQHDAKKKKMTQTRPDFELRARQLTGQPAGPGLGSGSARVIRDPQDLFAFQSGEVLVCDAVDPSMTFVMPLAGGIVECRGGMLVHGAIIAREYGIPCVTGVQDALTMIGTGTHLQVDGYLGIVTIEKLQPPGAKEREH